MSEHRFDVCGIGNALVDVISHESDEFIVAEFLDKGSMALIDTARADSLYAAMGPGIEISGGSAANTLAGIASLGGNPVFVGRVRDDQLGAVYRHDLRAAGVRFDTPAATDGLPTGRCLIVVTPDAQRTMSTYLGVSTKLGPDDVDPDVVAAAQITYLEGYLWDEAPAKDAFVKAAEAAKSAGRKVALSLSDSFCVDRHRASFLELLQGHVDVLFANEAEILALYEVDDFAAAVGHVKGHCEVAALTRGPAGATVIAGDATFDVAAAPVDDVVDTTGAGDLFAAGFLYGLTHAKSLEVCARLGAIAAAEIISHTGARPLAALDELANAAGLLS